MKTPANMMRTGLTILVAGYWLALFVATHIPHVPAALTMPGSDKWQHFTAYAGLALLLAARQSLGRFLTWKLAARIVGFVSLYGIFDELSQIPVGRDAELWDWYADVMGACSGVAMFTAFRALWNCRSRRPPATCH